MRAQADSPRTDENKQAVSATTASAKRDCSINNNERKLDWKWANG